MNAERKQLRIAMSKFSDRTAVAVLVCLFAVPVLGCEVIPRQASLQEAAQLKNLPQSGWTFPGHVQEVEVSLKIVDDFEMPAMGMKRSFDAGSGSRATFYDVRLELSQDVSERQQQIRELSRKFGRSSEFAVPLISDSAETYYLSDFVPARMQALQGMSYPKQSKVLRGLLGKSDLNRDPVIDNFVLRPEVRRVTNCWTTAFELMRQDPLQFSAWFASDRHIVPYLDAIGSDGQLLDEDTQWTSFVKELKWQQACIPDPSSWCPDGDLHMARNQGLKRGDLLLIHGEAGLEHAALYVGRDLYFEKTGARSTSQLYRLVPFSEIARSYASGRRSDLRFRFRRPRGDAVWPDPGQGFSSGWNEFEREVHDLMSADLRSLGAFPSWQPEVGDSRDLGIYLIETKKIAFDQLGRARLDRN